MSPPVAVYLIPLLFLLLLYTYFLVNAGYSKWFIFLGLAAWFWAFRSIVRESHADLMAIREPITKVWNRCKDGDREGEDYTLHFPGRVIDSHVTLTIENEHGVMIRELPDAYHWCSVFNPNPGLLLMIWRLLDHWARNSDQAWYNTWVPRLN